MASWFKKDKKREKESNIATTPKTEPKSKKATGAKVVFLLWNFFSIALYSCYTFFVTYKMSESTFLGKVILVFLSLYVLAFIILVLMNLRNKDKLKYSLKNYKSATNFLKYAVQIINFVLSIITAISAIFTTGELNFSTITFAALSLFITIIMILFEIAKIIIRKNIPIIKRNFLEIHESGYEENEEENQTEKSKNRRR